jgi:Cu/Ag efflux pump CusA
MLHLRSCRAVIMGMIVLGGGGYVCLSGLGQTPAEGNKPSKVDAPLPVLVSVTASLPGATPEEVEQQVTIPLELSFASTPRLVSLRSRSLTGISRVYALFQPGTSYQTARQEIINCLTLTELSPGITSMLPARSTTQSLRYLLIGPRDAQNQPIYLPQDLGTMQAWVLEREFRRLAGVSDVYSVGALSKRYEIYLDPDRMRRYAVTLKDVIDAIVQANGNGGDFLVQGKTVNLVRSIGTFGGGVDPVNAEVLNAQSPEKATRLLRDADKRRIREMREQVIARVAGVPIRLDDLVEGGPETRPDSLSPKGVVVGSHSPADSVGVRGPGERQEDAVVEGVICFRSEADADALRRVQAHIDELNSKTGKLLPGTRIETIHTSPQDNVHALWIYGTLPTHVALKAADEQAVEVCRDLLNIPQVDRIVFQAGGSVFAPEPQAFSQMQFLVCLKTTVGPEDRRKLIIAIERSLSSNFPGIYWLVSGKSPQELDQTLPGIAAEHLLLVQGSDLDKLDALAERIRDELEKVRGVKNVAVFQTLGQRRLEFRLDADKCRRHGVQTAEANAVLQLALPGKAISQMIEGEKRFDISLRWPERLRSDAEALLNLPVDLARNTGAGKTGELMPRLRVRDLVAPLAEDGGPDAKLPFMRNSPNAIYRSQGKRVVPIRFSIHERQLAEVQAEAGRRIDPLLRAPYRVEWGR